MKRRHHFNRYIHPLVIPMWLLSVTLISCEREIGLNNPFDSHVELSAPKDLQIASLSESNLSLAWNNALSISNENQAAQAFVVLEAGLDGKNFSPLDSSAASSKTGSFNKNFTLNQNYYFRTYFRVGSRRTEYSNIVTGKVTFNPPTGLSIGSNSEHRRVFTWHWTQVSEPASSFRLDRKTGSSGIFAVLQQIPAGDSTCIDTTMIKTDTTYYYRIYAVTKRNTLSAYDSLTMSIPFPAPGNFTCGGRDSNNVVLTWTNTSTLPYSTTIERSVDQSEFTAIGRVLTGTSSYTDSSVNKYHTYKYRLRNATTVNFSSYSSVLNANYQCSSAVLLGTTAAANYPRYIEVSRDGSTAFCLTNNTIQIVNVNSRSIVCNIALTNSQWWSRAALSGDGKVLAVAMRDTGAYYLYSTNNGQLIRRILAPRPTVDVAVSNDGSKVFTTGADSMIRIYNVSDGTLISSLQGHSSSPIALSFTRDGKTLISGSLNQIIFWDWQSNTKLTTTQGLFFERPIFILPDGNVYFLSFGYQTVYIYNLTQNKLITTLHAPDYTYEGFLTSDGLTLVAGGNGEFLVYNLITGSLIQRIDCPGAIVARTLDDTQLITGDGHRNGPYRFFQMIFSWVGS